MKILYYFSDHTANHERKLRNLPGGVGYYRICKVAEQASKKHEVTVQGVDFTKKGETMDERWDRIFKEYDVFWTSYTAHGDEVASMLYHRDKYKKKVVLDLDDNYLDVLESHPLYDNLKSTKRDKAFISTALSFADVVTVSTEPLKQRLAKHFKEVYNLQRQIIVLPNMNDLKDWDFKPKSNHRKKFVIGYMGSNSHQNDLAMFFPHLLNIMTKYDHVYFESIGSIDKKMLPLFNDFPHEVMKRCDLLPPTWTYKDYPEFIAGLRWNIGIAPLEDNAFTRCKSHIKFLEYSALKIPVIASKVYPYYVDIRGKKIIEHNKTGLLVKPSEWSDALEDLILNADKRKLLGENAYEHIKNVWQYEGSDIPEIIEEVLSATQNNQ